jgi:3-oxoacyl-[acyl-carrier-protein] synthase II
MKMTLAESGLSPAEIGYVGAHATGTTQGDAAEARAIGAVFGPEVPVSSLKGNMGHTLGASGPIELAATIEMMHAGIVYPTHHLTEIDPTCGGVNLVKEKTPHRFDTFLKNSFAFGGINSAIACRLLR